MRIGLAKGISEIVSHLRIERVQCVRSIEEDQSNGVMVCDVEGRFVHNSFNGFAYLSMLNQQCLFSVRRKWCLGQPEIVISVGFESIVRG